MRKKLIITLTYLAIMFFGPLVLTPKAEAALCPGTSLNTCTEVDSATCVAKGTDGTDIIPAYASTSACETCRTPGVTVPTVGYTWLNYPKGGVPNSAEPYINMPMPAAHDYQPVHLYTSRLGCSGRADTQYTGANPLIGVMSIKDGSELSYYSDYLGNYMNQKLEEYAASYADVRDPLYDSMLAVTLKDFPVLPKVGPGPDDYTLRKFLDITVSRDNPYGENFMQKPGSNNSGVINIPMAINRCNEEGQFNDDNDCDLTIYIGAGAQEGYAILDMVAYLKIRIDLPSAAVNFMGSVASSVATAKLDDTIIFTHSMGASYRGNVVKANADYSFGGDPIASPSGPRTLGPINYFKPEITSQSATATETHKVTLADAQRGYVCRTISWTSSATTPVPTNNPVGRTAQKCVPVIYNYELTPSVTVPSSAEPGATITPAPLVTRSGDPLSSNSDWTLTRVILPASNKTNFGSAPVVNSSSPAAHYNSLTGVASVTHASGSNIFSNKDTNLTVSGFDLDPTLQIGQRVCFGLSVKPYINTSSTNYKHSALDCVTISKSPSAQIHGGGLLVANGKVVGGSSRQYSTNKSFGSWAEYDITANGTVDQMVASAMGYGLDGKTPDPDSKNLQKLTFANTPSYGSFGAANTLSHSLVTGGLTNPYKFFVDSAVNLSASTGALTVTPSGLGSTYGETKVYKHSSDITLNASTLPLGKQIVLIAENSNIYINGNQTYTNLINGPKSLPQLVLIAYNGNIIINESVTNVDAWIIASSETDDKKGQLWTCHIKPANSAQCDDQLAVNGPVMVDYLRLYRIYGSDYSRPLGFGSGGLNDPAEIFNLRPDAYIWSLQNSQSNTLLKTTHIKDLAPRY